MKLNKKGLTLIEILIAVAIFGIIILVAVSGAIAYINGRKDINQKQQYVEQMSVAMNDMAKRIRMSNCDDGCVFDNLSVVVYENASGYWINYQFAGNKLIYYNEIESPMVLAEDVDGAFASNDAEIPLVTIQMWKLDKSSHAKIDGTTLQTSVSMRSGYSPPATP